MRKLFFLFCCSVSLVLLVNACGNTEDDSSNFMDSAVDLGEEFIGKLYTIEDSSIDYNSMSIESLIDIQNDFSSYFTEKEFEELVSKRLFLMPLEAASKQNSTISVRNIEFENFDFEQSGSESLELDHSFTLIFIDTEGNEVDEVEINGQITFIDSKNGLKIDRYYDSEIPVDMLYP